MQNSKVTIRPLTPGKANRFIVVTLHGDQHVICYPQSMHKTCNPFNPAPAEQLLETNEFKTIPWPEETKSIESDK